MLGGSPGKFLTKWCDLAQSGGIPKYVITNLKINNFKEKNEQENLIAVFLSQNNLDEHVSSKINTFRICKGSLGARPRKAEDIFLKIKQNGGFSLFFFYFFAYWQGSLNPQNYELAP